MKRDEVLDVLLDMYETYQYLMTKLDVTKDTLESNSKGETINDFEREKILDVIASALQKHEEIVPDLKQLQDYIKSGKSA